MSLSSRYNYNKCKFQKPAECVSNYTENNKCPYLAAIIITNANIRNRRNVCHFKLKLVGQN